MTIRSIIDELIEQESTSYWLLPNHTWYVQCPMERDDEIVIMKPDINDNDGKFYKLIVRIDSILAIEVSVDPRGNDYNLPTPDFEDGEKLLEDDKNA